MKKKERKKETTAMQYLQSSFWTDRNIYLFGSILGMLPKHGYSINRSTFTVCLIT